MAKNKKLKICYMGSSQAGVVGVLTLLSAGHKVIAAVSHLRELSEILKLFKIPIFSSINDRDFLSAMKRCDLLVSVHGRQLLNKSQLKLPKLGCINAHPYLYMYKGVDPVGRALENRNFKGSVGVHMMKEEVDAGDVLVEEFINVTGARTRDEIYNRLYPYYAISILKALKNIAGKTGV